MADYDIDAVEKAIRSGDMANVPAEFKDIAEQYRTSGQASAGNVDLPEDQTPEAVWTVPFNEAAASEEQKAKMYAKAAGSTGATDDGSEPVLTFVDRVNGEPRYVSDRKLSTLFGTIEAGQPFHLNKPGASWQDVTTVLDAVPAMLLTPTVTATSLGGATVLGTAGAIGAVGAGGYADWLTGDYRSIGRRVFDGTVGAVTNMLGGVAGQKIGEMLPKAAEWGLAKLFQEKTLKQMDAPIIDATTGDLTPLAAETLRKAGVNPDEIAGAVTQALRNRPEIKLLDPEQAVRAAEQLKLGIEPTKASITQAPTDIGAESKLASVFNRPYAEQLASASDKVVDYGRKLAGLIPNRKPDVADIVQKTGGMIREALGVAKNAERKVTNQLFDTARAMKGSKDFELPTDKIRQTYNDLFDDTKYGLRDQFKAEAATLKDMLGTVGIGIGNDASKSSDVFNVNAAQALMENLNNLAEKNPFLSKPVFKLKEAVKQSLDDAVNNQSSIQPGVRGLPMQVPGSPPEVVKHIQAYSAAKAAYLEQQSRWAAADTVFDILKPREDFSPLFAIKDSSVVGKLRSSSREDVRRFMNVLMDASKHSDPQIADAAVQARDALRGSILLDGIENSLVRGEQSGAQYLDVNRLNRYYDEFDANALRDILSEDQMRGLNATRRMLTNMRMGPLSKSTGAADPVDLEKKQRQGISSFLSTAWLYLHQPYIAGAVLAGKAGLAGLEDTATKRATAGTMQGIKTLTTFKNLDQSQRKLLMDEIQRQYPKTYAYMVRDAEGIGRGVKAAGQKLGAAESWQQQYQERQYE